MKNSLLLALGGPAAVGLCLGLHEGAGHLLWLTLSLPAILVGTASLMAPSLYVAAAVGGMAPTSRDVADAVGDGVTGAGAAMAGLAPALAYLIATATSPWTTLVTGHLAVLAAMLLALRRLFGGSEHPLRALSLFGAWSFVALGIGWRLFVGVLL